MNIKWDTEKGRYHCLDCDGAWECWCIDEDWPDPICECGEPAFACKCEEVFEDWIEE